ncbi:hypothetical protein TWF730_001303 [Orbilia blumenaviensis]|uniref:Uncharacterized protein n=1 Tax=Orbilia blumenaviensis TaxID=1796055 RepID=A0AAV9UHH4_9PEZI
MRDDDTASIWSNAPSYRSSIDPPPYSADGGLPSYTSSTSSNPRSLLGVSSSRSSAGPSIASRGLPPIPASTSGLPPVALITPGSRVPQSRQYQAVAARRQAKQASKANNVYNPNFSSRIFPRDNPIRQKAPGLTYDTYNSLHPVLSARDSPRALSTAELFLCTCGRHNKDGEDRDDDRRFIDPRAPKPLHNPIFDEPCPSTLRPTATKEVVVKKAEETPMAWKDENKTGPVDMAGKLGDVKVSKEEDTEEPKEQDELDSEGKSWDFMMSQM